MLMPSIFGENLFDDWFDSFPFYDMDKEINNTEKKLYGKVSLGTIRKTFLIDEEGNIEKIWNKVSVATHGEDVVKYLDQK